MPTKLWNKAFDVVHVVFISMIYLFLPLLFSSM